MSHPFLFGFIVGWWGSSLIACIVFATLKLRRPLSTPKARALPPTRREPPPMPACKPARDADMWDVGSINYEFLGVTGEER